MLWIIIAFVAGCILSPFAIRLFKVGMEALNKEVTGVEEDHGDHKP